MSRITIIGLACALFGAGCLGTPTVGDHEAGIVSSEEAAELYSADGCSGLRSSSLDLVEIAVADRDDLVALAVDGVVLCVHDVGALETSGAPLPTFGDQWVPILSTTATMGGEAQDPDPEPASPGTGIAHDPDPEPATPPRAGPGPLL